MNYELDWGYWVKDEHSVRWVDCGNRRGAEEYIAYSAKLAPSALRGPVQRRSDPNPFEANGAEEVREFAYDRTGTNACGVCPGCGVVDHNEAHSYACVRCYIAHSSCCCAGAGGGGDIAIRDRIYAHAKSQRHAAKLADAPRGSGVVFPGFPKSVTEGVGAVLELSPAWLVTEARLAELLFATDPRILAFIESRRDGITAAKVWAAGALADGQKPTRDEQRWRGECEERASGMVAVMSAAKK